MPFVDVEAAAGRVELDHDGRRALALRPRDPFREVAGPSPGRRRRSSAERRLRARRRGRHAGGQHQDQGQVTGPSSRRVRDGPRWSYVRRGSIALDGRWSPGIDRAARRARGASNTSRLHVSRSGATAATSSGVGEPPAELVDLADRDRPTRGISHEDRAEVDLHRRASCRRSGARQTRIPGSKSATSSSAHSRRSPPSRFPSPGLRWPPTPIDQRSWSRASPPARVRRMRKYRSPSRRTRYGMICLKRRIGLHRRARTELPVSLDRLDERVEVAPAGARTSRRRRSRRRAGRRRRARRRSRLLLEAAPGSREPLGDRSPHPAHPPDRIRPATRRARSAAREARRRSPGAFVATIPAPISSSPRASRVMLCQPPAARRPPRATRPSRPSPPATASTRAAATTSGRWLIAATATS